MDLNSLGSLSNFDTFDDDVSKESNDLTVDAGLSNESPFLSSVSQAEIGHGLTIVPSTSESQDQHSEPMKRKGSKSAKRNLTYLLPRCQSSLGMNGQIYQHEKQRYLDDAEREKEKYMKDLEAYQKTETYKTFKQQIEKKGKEDTTTDFQGVNVTEAREEEESGTFDIPIFTEEFLDHNKARDAELRQLRKQTTELEEQNAILSKHTDNMRQAVERLEAEAQQHRQTNHALLAHLDALRGCLTSSFSSVPLPGTGEFPTLETIDTYMAKLHSFILDSPQENEQLIATVRDIVGRPLSNSDSCGLSVPPFHPEKVLALLHI
ncbi:SWI/SNF- matrix-associated actin-dependent regulator of chromatin sub E member 1 [Bulinus truncatus]|nr:SWI/SNF- matrix-associated actin-dependent regulator of chromatin sub E member 1 [Bulinus truncatus]